MLDRLLRERQADWGRLDALLRETEALPDRRLGAERLHEILRLYRQVCSDLNEARALTANPSVLGRLNDLAGRGYRVVYARPQARRLAKALRRLLSTEIPLAFRAQRSVVLQAGAAFLLGALLGAGAVLVDRENARRLTPPQFFTESPRDRVARIEQGEERIDSVEKALTFGASLYTHNIQVSFLAFSLGAVSLVGGLWLLFYNGVILGAVAAAYVLDGLSGFFLGWVGPHGALELPAIIFSGAAGLRLGAALLLPGDATTGTALRAAFPPVWRMMTGVVLMLVIAGLVEGSLSQFSSRILPQSLKITVAGALLVSLLGYLFVRRLDEPAGAP
jgi:uncharacterized membrane protein SpoIIM required for sporulation